MKFIKVSLTLFVFLFTISIASAVTKSQDKPIKKAHSDLTCFDCHLENNPTHSLKVTCSECHGTAEDVSKLTEGKYKEHYDPHMPLHYGENALCENCHREHTPSKLECNNPYCHTEFKYDVP